MRDALSRAHGFALRWRARLTSNRAGLVVVYHRVGGAGGDPKREILPAVSGSDFARQLHHLRRHYRVVSARDILEATRSRGRGGRFPVAITFDDDLASHVREALPALRRAKLVATFFLTGTSLHGPHAFWWEDLQHALDNRLVTADSIPHVPEGVVRDALDRQSGAIFRVAAAIESLEPGQRHEVASALRAAVGPPSTESGLRSQDVRALTEAGCEVGFHTLRHDLLPTLSSAALERALSEGRDELATETRRTLDLIAYPHGRADGRVADAARTAGFALGFTTERAPVAPDDDPLLVPRIVPALSASRFALRVARTLAGRP